MIIMKKATIAAVSAAFLVLPAAAAVLYSHGGQVVATSSFTLPGVELIMNDSASGSLYFRFTVHLPESNSGNENYFAGMNFFLEDAEGLGVGNAWAPHAYSAWNSTGGNVDLNSAQREAGVNWQYVRATDITVIAFRVDYVPGGADQVKVWLNPDFSLAEEAQDPALTTTFEANASFDNIRLRHGNTGSWDFRDIVIADSWTSVPEPAATLLGGLGLLGLLRRRRG